MKKHPCKELPLDAARLGRARDAGHLALDCDVLAVDIKGRLPGSDSGTTKRPSGKSPCPRLTPIAQHPGVSDFPICGLRKKMKRVAKWNTCIHLPGRDTWWNL